jgi:hypothetical protein
MIRIAPLHRLVGALLAAGLAACAPAAELTPEQRQRSAVEEACRREATRVVLYRDRGQTMRIDEAESRVGVQSSIPTFRGETDRLGQQVERDRLASECIRANTGDAAPAARPAAPARPGS